MKQYLTPQRIAEITGGEYVGDEAGRGVRISGAAHDNREVKPGNLFICIRGERSDGHTFASSAFQAGAACCLAERVLDGAAGPYVLVGSTLEAIKQIGGYYRSLFDIPVIGITGSVGKTTVKELTAAVLGAKFHVHKTHENLNNELGVPLTLLSLHGNHGVAVIEMGVSDFGEMGRLAEMVRPDILVMTKIGYSHLEKFGDLAGVLRAKSEVFEYMKPGSVAVLNGGDELLREYDPGMRKILFGLGEQCDFRAENIRAEGTDAVICDIAYDSGRFTVKIPAYGSHLAPMAAAAAAVGRLLGLSDDDISRGLLTYTPVGGRANVRSTGYITLIDDCYNANPNSVKEALKSLSNLPGRRVAILGDMFELGESSDEQHRETGAEAARCGIEPLICCGDKAAMIHSGYIAAGGAGSRYYPSKAELAEALPELIKKGDAVLVKASHGMHFEEILPLLLGLREEV